MVLFSFDWAVGDGFSFVKIELFEPIGCDIVIDNLTIAKHDDTPRESRDFDFMGHGDDRDSGSVEFGENRHHFLGGVGVECAGGFVGQDQGGTVDDRAGDGDALLLTAGELVGFVVESVAEADAIEGSGGAIEAFARWDVAVDRRQHDVFEGAEGSEQMELLEDEAEFLVADFGEVGLRDLRYVDAVEGIVADRRAIEAADDVHGGGFSRAGGADDRAVFARLNRQGNVIEGANFGVAAAVDFGDAIELHDRIGRHLGWACRRVCHHLLNTRCCC